MRLSWQHKVATAALVMALLAAMAVALLWTEQRRILYVGSGRAHDIWNNPPEGYRIVSLRTSDGLVLKSLYRPAAPGMRTVLFFHGNGDTVIGGARIVDPLVNAGYGAFLSEFRGYAGNPGSPDENGLYRDGGAAWSKLRSFGVSSERMIVVGYSLGSGVASRIAVERRPAAVILVSPYTSIPDVAAQHFGGWVRPLVSDTYPTKDRIARIGAPMMLLHGADDTTVPATHSVELHQLNSKADLLIVPGQDHVFAFTPGAGGMMLAWLEGKAL